MQIDIRSETYDDIKKIYYADDEYLERTANGAMEIRVGEHHFVEIWIHDIDNLIKALQKAKEIWDVES